MSGSPSRDAASQQLLDWKKDNGGGEPETARKPDGIPYSSLTTTLTCGFRGPPLLQDTDCISLLQNFVRKNQPPRVVHGKGTGVYGRFKLTNKDFAKYSKACIFQPKDNNNDDKGDVEMLFRFGLPDDIQAPDHSRDFFGMSMKFYTDEGNYDVLCINFPVSNARHPINFTNSVATGIPNPKTKAQPIDQNFNWDLITLEPQNLHLSFVQFSDRGLPLSSRYSAYFPINIFKLVNAQGDYFFARYQFKSNQGNKYVTEEQAVFFRKGDPDYIVRDMYNAIERKDFPSWTWLVQIMDKDEPAKYQKKYGYSAFDVTKVWPQSEYPAIEIGQVICDRHVDNFFEEVESAKFNPGSFIPGVEAPIEDILLQGRIFMYSQTQLYRIGKNKSMLPCNQPRNLQAPFATYYRQGLMNFGTGLQGGSPVYFPNHFGGPNSARDRDNNINHNGEEFKGILDIYDYGSDSYDNYTQPRIYYEEILDEGEKDRLAQNIAVQIYQATKTIQKTVFQIMNKVSVELARKIEQKLREMK